jgi:hypothetical protein
MISPFGRKRGLDESFGLAAPRIHGATIGVRLQIDAG